MKKFELTDETMTVDGVTYHRIRACKDFDVQGYHVKAEKFGGYVESECNIDQNGNAWVDGNAMVGGNARVRGNAWVGGDALVGGNARVSKSDYVIVIGPIGSRNDYTTFYRSKDNDIIVRCGCFNGNLLEFLEKVNETHGNNKYAAEYRAAAELAKIHIDLEGEKTE